MNNRVYRTFCIRLMCGVFSIELTMTPIAI